MINMMDVRQKYDESTTKVLRKYSERIAELRRKYDKSTKYIVLVLYFQSYFRGNSDETTMKVRMCFLVDVVCWCVVIVLPVVSWENCELVLAKISLAFGVVLLYNTQTSYKTCASPHLHVLTHMSSLLVFISVSRLLFNMYGVRLSCGASGNSVTSVHTRRYTM